MAKIALTVGIDTYLHIPPLNGCVNDALSMRSLLERHEDHSPNFDVIELLSTTSRIETSDLRSAVTELFSKKCEIALFYFAGHGALTASGGFLCSTNAKKSDEGLSMSEITALANGSPAKERIIIADCCHSGALGEIFTGRAQTVTLAEGVCVLSASLKEELSAEVGGHGVFTSLIAGALDGGAADVLGRVTLASVYAYVDQALTGWDQRPTFKAHLTEFQPVRLCRAPIDAEILRLLPDLFPSPDFEFQLDSSYEPDALPSHPEHEQVFGKLQKLRANRLVVPIGEDHLYFAAMKSKTCQLTPLGKYYWQLAKAKRI